MEPMQKYLLIRSKKSAYIAKATTVGSVTEYWLITCRLPYQTAKDLLKEFLVK